MRCLEIHDTIILYRSAERRTKERAMHEKFSVRIETALATHGEIRLRCVTQPDPVQAALLDRLGLVLPKRMRLADAEIPAIAISA